MVYPKHDKEHLNHGQENQMLVPWNDDRHNDKSIKNSIFLKQLHGAYNERSTIHLCVCVRACPMVVQYGIASTIPSILV
jgi:hypothetical protein